VAEERTVLNGGNVNIRTLARSLGYTVAAMAIAPNAALADGIDVGRTSGGRLAAVVEAAQPFPLPNSPFPGIEGYSTGAIGISSIEIEHADEGLFPLPPSADVRFILVSADDDLLVYAGLSPLPIGGGGVLGNPFFDFHPIYNISRGGPGTTKSLQLVLRDMSGQFADSEPITLTFVATPACPGDIDGDSTVGLGDVAAIIACWGEEDHCNHEADLDLSHDIGLGDIAVVIQFWSSTCP
jgi:hypothetical protein